MKHIHHILPKHMGGTNDPTNLISLSVEDHAEAHKRLYEQHGKEEDRIAWLALSGQINKQEALTLSRKLGRKISDKKLQERYGDNWRSVLSKLRGNKGAEAARKYKVGIFDPVKSKEYQQRGSKAALTEEARSKRKATFKEIGHQKGEKNSHFGKCWIRSDAEQKSIRIHKSELQSYLNQGWIKGRKFYSLIV